MVDTQAWRNPVATAHPDAAGRDSRRRSAIAASLKSRDVSRDPAAQHPSGRCGAGNLWAEAGRAPHSAAPALCPLQAGSSPTPRRIQRPRSRLRDPHPPNPQLVSMKAGRSTGPAQRTKWVARIGDKQNPGQNLMSQPHAVVGADVSRRGSTNAHQNQRMHRGNDRYNLTALVGMTASDPTKGVELHALGQGADGP
jgi:hypothetical protein